MSLSVNSPVPKDPAWYTINARDLETIRRTIIRLYSEHRFVGDEMRDAAQRLNGAFDNVFADDTPTTEALKATEAPTHKHGIECYEKGAQGLGPKYTPCRADGLDANLREMRMVDFEPLQAANAVVRGLTLICGHPSCTPATDRLRDRHTATPRRL